MSAEPDLNNLTSNVMRRLDQATRRLPVSQLISELQVAVERVSFSGIHRLKPQSSQEFATEIDLLFDGEISEDMLQFIYWLASFDALSILADKTGELFINFCIKQYRSMSEVRFITSVELPTETRQFIAEKLAALYPEHTRVVYEVMPSIVAGFVIRDGSKVIDRSLRSHMMSATKQHVMDRIRKEPMHG